METNVETKTALAVNIIKPVNKKFLLKGTLSFASDGVAVLTIPYYSTRLLERDVQEGITIVAEDWQ